MSASNVVPSGGAAAAVAAARTYVFVSSGALLIAGLAWLAYWPSLSGGFIWDDRLYLTNCDLVKAPDGLYKFWFTTEPIDYWPLSNTSLWFEWRLWGMNPAGYRVTNLLLHIGVALLIWALLAKLSIPGAFLAALLFVVHPVNVESVAWIAQRKSLLAMLLSLLSLIFFCKALQPTPAANRVDPIYSATRRDRVAGNPWYWLSLATFLLAMLSKGSVAFLPGVLLGILWWRQRRFTLADVSAALPFFGVAVALSVVNIWFQQQHSGAGIRFAALDERLAGAGAVPWFYLSKALLPIDLVFIYPRWKIDPSDARWWLPLCASAVFTLILWRSRRRLWGRPLLVAWLLFCLALGPVLGFTDVYFMKFSLVADHYQYHALVLVVAVMAAAWSVWWQSAGAGRRSPAAASVVAAVTALTVLTFQQCKLYRDAGIMWQSTLASNPNSSVAHVNLGVMLAGANDLQEALRHFQDALRIDSTDADAHNNLGAVYFKMGRLPEAIDQYQQALKFGFDNAETRSNLGLALARVGRTQEAIDHFQHALRLNRALVDTRLALGLALMNDGRDRAAIEQFTQVLQSRPDNVSALFNLATIYVKLDQPADAISAAEKACDCANRQGQADLAGQIAGWLKSYRDSLPRPGK